VRRVTFLSVIYMIMSHNWRFWKIRRGRQLAKLVTTAVH
jgi:hypothetical protein